MNLAFSNRPFVALVDDDFHSARFLIRTLNAHGTSEVRWMGDAEAALQQLRQLFTETNPVRPSLIIVDLKASSGACAAFISELGSTDMPVVALSPEFDDAAHHHLLEAGAACVFRRHSDLAAYRAEVAKIVDFWAQHQQLDHVGT